MMKKQALIVKSGTAHALSVLGTQVRFLCESESTGKAFSLMEVVLPPDAGPPLHDHDWDEAYYVTKGEVEFTIGTETVTVQEGDFIYAPGGTLHGFHGISAEAARMLIFDAPAHAGSFFKEVDREVRMPGDMAKVPEIGLRNGIRFIRPS
jgi:quercetin dioxygenase-like cupin family protein